MPHPVAHVEIGGPDPATLRRYYTELFGWTIEPDNAVRYGMVAAVAPGIRGGVGPTPDGAGHVSFYVGTEDLEATLDKAESLGGRTVMPPMDVPDGPSIGQFADPQGNVIGLVKGL